MRMLRNSTGVRWDYLVRNEDIRERLCQAPVSINLRRTRLKWFRQVERMGGERQVKRIMNAETEGRRLVGRPQTRWKDILRRDLTSSGLSLGEAAAEALDRDSCRTIVRASCDFNAAGS